MKTFPKRKLTPADGEYILWHVLGYLRAEDDAAATIIEVILGIANPAVNLLPQYRGLGRVEEQS